MSALASIGAGIATFFAYKGGEAAWKALASSYREKRRGDVALAEVAAKTDVALAEVAAKAHAREDDITRETALEDRSDRRRMEQEIRGLRDELLEAKVANARLEAERDRLREEHGDRDTLLELVATLRTQVDMQSQLIERQKTQIDDLVRRLMTRDSIPPGATA